VATGAEEVTARHDGAGAANDAHMTKPLRSAGCLRSCEREVLLALLAGPKYREEVDRIAEVSNGPDVIFELRAGGVDIDCERIAVVNRHGRTVRPGRYALTTGGRTRATSMFKLQADEQAADQKRRQSGDAAAP
jgi:hypothetical protein